MEAGKEQEVAGNNEALYFCLLFAKHADLASLKLLRHTCKSSKPLLSGAVYQCSGHQGPEKCGASINLMEAVKSVGPLGILRYLGSFHSTE